MLWTKGILLGGGCHRLAGVSSRRQYSTKDLKEGREGAFELPGKEYSADRPASTKILRQGIPGVLEEGLGGPCGWNQRDRGKRWSREVMGVDPVWDLWTTGRIVFFLCSDASEQGRDQI